MEDKMYIYKIEIQNFRNLKNFTWKPNKHINILFGHNGCGKTNIAEALSYLFTPNRYRTYFDKSDYHLGVPTNKIIIRAWLADIESFSAEISLNIQHIDEEDNFVTDDYDGNTRQVLILQLESSDEDKMEWSFVLSTGAHPCSMKDRAAINYNYVDTIRNPIKEVGMQEKSVLYQLAKEDIGDELDDISKDIVSYADRKLSESKIVEKYLGTLKKMGKLDMIEKYKLLLKNPESSWNSSGYELGTKAGEAILTFDKQSSGIQNLFLLLLMKKKLEGSIALLCTSKKRLFGDTLEDITKLTFESFNRKKKTGYKKIKHLISKNPDTCDYRLIVNLILKIICIIETEGDSISFTIRKFIEQCANLIQPTLESIDSVMLQRQYTNSFTNITPGLYITTIHQSKGKEFDYVFVADVNQLMKDKNLLYVSHSRMKERLYPIAITYNGLQYGK